MDVNLVVLCGRQATLPELKVFDSGTRMLRLLVVVKSDEPTRRTDVIPVLVWVCGSVQRRFSDLSEGRRSRLKVVAHAVDPGAIEAEEAAR